LTTVELRQRKATVIAGLKDKILERKELEDGIVLRFDGRDEMVDTLVSFIKTERACCNFFTFTLSIAGNPNPVWLTIRGPEGAREFMASELRL